MLSTPLFIDGTSSSKTYIVMARKGDLVLGLRPLGLVDGSMVGMDGRVILQVRLRSAAITPEIEEILGAPEDGGVVQFSKVTGKADAWPAIQFGKIDTTRASMILLTPIRGSLKKGEAGATLAKIAKGSFIEQLIQKVADLAGPDFAVSRVGPVSTYIRETLKLTYEDGEKYEKMGDLELQQQDYANSLPEEPIADTVAFAKLKQMAEMLKPAAEAEVHEVSNGMAKVIPFSGVPDNAFEGEIVDDEDAEDDEGKQD